MNSKKLHHPTAGFSLVEALVAITVMLIVIGAAFSSISSSIKHSYFARDQIVAFYLAQEANEYIRNVIHSNNEEGVDWLVGLGDCLINQTPNNSGCNIDVHDDEVKDIDTDEEYSKMYLNDEGKYQPDQDSWDYSGFDRIIKITTEEDDRVKVDIEIKWGDKEDDTTSFTASGYLYKWRAEIE